MLVTCTVSAFACARESSIAARGRIVASDGVVLASSQNVANGEGERVYPFGASMSPVVGSCITQGVADGVEQAYAGDLLAGKDIVLTVDSRIQQAAVNALDGRTGAIVVLDSGTGSVLALASTPVYDPAQSDAPDAERVNHATELHIPGSTFKTITLAEALESGASSMHDVFDAPLELTFEDGSVTNYGSSGNSMQALSQAYAQSTNTVFAQLGLQLGVEAVADRARAFGFESELLTDIPCAVSTFQDKGDMTLLAQAWACVGQSLYQDDGTLQGPLMTPVQGAAIAAAVVNEGKLLRPYLVSSVGDVATEAAIVPDVIGNPLSSEHAAAIAACMREVVQSGTGASAAVPGVDVGGKTGTAETLGGTDDGWFIGYASKGGHAYAFSVMVQDAPSSEASSVAAQIVGALF